MWAPLLTLSKLAGIWRQKAPQALEVRVADAMTVYASLGYKFKRRGKGKPVVEGFTGDDLHRKSGRWMKKVRFIDRENDRYFEEVMDPETGGTVRRCEEPLSAHRGHGNATEHPPIK